MTNFLRQKWKEKPQAWGSFESVQRSSLKNAEKIGVKAPLLLFPLWEKSGQQSQCFNRGKSIAATIDNNIAWHNQGLTFPTNQQVGVRLPLNSVAMPQTSKYTILASGYYTDSYGATSVPRAIIGIGGSGYNNRLIFGFGHLGNGSSYQPKLCIDDKQIGKSIKGQTDVVNTNYNCAYQFDGTNNKLFLNGNVESFTGTEMGGLSFVPTNFTLGACRYNNDSSILYGYVYDSPAQIYIVTVFDDAIDNQIIALLSDYPFLLLQRQPDVFFSFAREATGQQTTINTAWLIRVLSSQQSSWHILDNAFQSSAWKIVNESAADSKYKILTDINQETAWKIFNTISQATDSKILNSENLDTGYQILNDIYQDTTYKIKALQDVETAWQILSTGLFEQALSWKILNSDSIESAFRILTQSDAITAWKIQNVKDDQAAWNIVNQNTQDTVYKIKNDNLIDLSYKIINVKDYVLSYNILKLLENNTEWQILNSETINTSWSLFSDNIPTALYQFIQAQKTVLFNQAKRTFIITQAKKG